jgi:hypothetical protein
MAEVYELEHLVEVACSDAAAWQRLWTVIEPQLWEMVDRPRFASHLAHTEDARRRIVTAIRAQLAATQLQRFVEARRVNPRLGFTRWLRTVAKRIGMSYASGADVGEPARRPSARRILV